MLLIFLSFFSMAEAGVDTPCDILLYYFFMARSGDRAPCDITPYQFFMAEAGYGVPLLCSFEPGIGFSLLPSLTIHFNVMTDIVVYCHDGLLLLFILSFVVAC